METNESSQFIIWGDYLVSKIILFNTQGQFSQKTLHSLENNILAKIIQILPLFYLWKTRYRVKVQCYCFIRSLCSYLGCDEFTVLSTVLTSHLGRVSYINYITHFMCPFLIVLNIFAVNKREYLKLLVGMLL